MLFWAVNGVFLTMRTMLNALLLISGLAAVPSLSYSQGMPIDSLRLRFSRELGISDAPEQLRPLVANYENMRVWGMAIGDFSNDRTNDLALSLYDLKGPRQRVNVYLFQNIDGQLRKMMVRNAGFVESPIEVGLSTDNSVLSIIQKVSDDHWFQEGYSVQFGDVILTERFETVTQAGAGARQRNFGHQINRDFETLLTKEAYFGGTEGENLLSTEYYTFPAYNRLRNVYPGYGSWMRDTTRGFILEGLVHRRDAGDLSIHQAQAAYDDEFIYVSTSVRDDYISASGRNVTTKDRLTLWFDTYMKGDRKVYPKKSGKEAFRTRADSFVYSITIPLSSVEGRLEGIDYTSVGQLNGLQQSGAAEIRAQMTHDTIDGRLVGYTVRTRIPWTFFGFDMNPVSLYETRAPQSVTIPSELVEVKDEESPQIGFTVVVHDIDDPARPGESTVQATSRIRENDPSTFGTMDLKPSTQFYGLVYSTYYDIVKRGLLDAGF